MTHYFEKTFSFWKLSFLPANLQNLHLQIVNHKLKMNDQLKHFTNDENNDPVKGDCTFCKLNGIEIQAHLCGMYRKQIGFRSNCKQE